MLLEALDRRRLLVGVAVLLIVGGACLVTFSSGGLLNEAYLPTVWVRDPPSVRESAPPAPSAFGLREIPLPPGRTMAQLLDEEMRKRWLADHPFEWRVDLWQPGPLAGSILLGLGSLGLLLAYAWRPRPS